MKVLNSTIRMFKPVSTCVIDDPYTFITLQAAMVDLMLGRLVDHIINCSPPIHITQNGITSGSIVLTTIESTYVYYIGRVKLYSTSNYKEIAAVNPILGSVLLYVAVIE